MNNSKNSVRTLTMLALLVAMSIVFSTRLNTMLIATSKASMVSVRTEFFELFISTVLLQKEYRAGGLHKQKRPPCDKPHKGRA